MICSDIWHKYHKWYFEIVIRNFTSRQASEIWDNFEISRVVFMPQNITYKSCYYMFILLPWKVLYFSHVGYFKLSWNTTALNQSNRRNFLCSSIKVKNKGNKTKEFWKHFFYQTSCRNHFQALTEGYLQSLLLPVVWNIYGRLMNP